MPNDSQLEEPKSTTATTVFALLLDKSAIGIYTTFAGAERAWQSFQLDQGSANKNYQIKPFCLNGPARIYPPY